jgi:protein-S-isoprenylcysteine O-methyltransferase Ste14
MVIDEKKYKQGQFLFKYRGVLPIVVLIVGLVLFYFNTTEYNNSIIFEVICFSISSLGFGIRVFTVGYTPQNSSGRNTEIQVADTLNTTGIYSLVRHPLYLGNFLMWFGIALMTKNIWFILLFIFLFTIFYQRIIYVEETFLEEKFGNNFKTWASKTPIIGLNLSKYITPNLSFSIKKVLKKEKNGFCALFLVFFLFRAIHDLEIHQQLVFDSVLFYATIFSLLLYLILKYLKKYTKILDEQGR